MKKIFLLFLLVSTTLAAQTEEELKAMAIKDAKATSQATLDMDYKGIIKYTHPNIINAMGGSEKMEEILKQSFSGMLEEAGISIDKSDIGELLAIKKEEGEYRCLIENSIVMTLRVQKKRISKKSTLFGFYNETNKQWTFVEANKLGKGGSEQFFPNFKTSIEIPEDQQTIEDF